MRRSTKLMLLASLLSFVPMSETLAQQQSSQQDSQPVANKSEAADNARKAVNGRVLRVDKKNNSYRVKVLKKSGRVVSVDVDKQSGQVKSDKQQDDKG